MASSFIEQVRQLCKDDASFERLLTVLSANGLAIPSALHDATTQPAQKRRGEAVSNANALANNNLTNSLANNGDEAQRLVRERWLARLIDEVLPDVVYLYNAATQEYVYSNRAVVHFGYTPDQFLCGGDDVVRMLLHPNEREHIMQEYQRAFLATTSKFTTEQPKTTTKRGKRTATFSQEQQSFSPFFEIQCRMRCADGSYRWVHDRRFVLERSSDGMPTMILGYLSDLQSMKELQDLLEYRTGLEKVTATISREFAKLAVSDIDAAVMDALRLIGEATDTDRCYIFLTREFAYSGSEPMHQAFQWLREGVPPMLIKKIDPQQLSWAFERLQQLRSLQIAHLDSLPKEAALLRRALLAAGTRSLLAVPLHMEGRIIGVLGLSSVRSERVWTKEEVRMLRLTAEILVYAFDRKRAEEFLRQSEARFRTIFDRAPIAISILNSSGKLLSHNQQLAKLLGYSSEELHQLDFLSCVRPEFRDRSEELFYELLTGAIDSFTLELQYLRKDGSPVWINLTSSVVRDAEGKPMFVIRMLEDISERKQAEANMSHYTTLLAEHREALERQSDMLLQLNGEMMMKQRELEEMNRSKDKFFSIISHDLRSPFSSLLGIAKMLSENTATLSSDDVRELASAMHQQTVNVYEFMENLLKWAQAHTGRMQYKPTVIALHEITASVEMLLRENAHSKNITLINDVPPDVAVFIDENMIRSVVQNLVSNALKFTPSGGSVRLHAHAHPTNPKMVELCVSDTGIGMSQEDAHKLFRIDVVHTTKGTEDETGSGLGLILCKELVEKNKGAIHVESMPGKGTTFTCSLPLAKEW